MSNIHRPFAYVSYTCICLIYIVFLHMSHIHMSHIHRSFAIANTAERPHAHVAGRHIRTLTWQAGTYKEKSLPIENKNSFAIESTPSRDKNSFTIASTTKILSLLSTTKILSLSRVHEHGRTFAWQAQMQNIKRQTTNCSIVGAKSKH